MIKRTKKINNGMITKAEDTGNVWQEYYAEKFSGVREGKYKTDNKKGTRTQKNLVYQRKPWQK